MDKFHKLDLALRQYLLGAKYYLALESYAFAKQYHVGFRKDGVTPEFQHQLEMALAVTNLKGLGSDEERIIAAVLLHDVCEDYNVSRDLIRLKFGAGVETPVWLMTKVYNGVKKDAAHYFSEIANDPAASVGKGVDRINNLQSMNGVFTVDKQKEYVAEARNFFLPMLKMASQKFPDKFHAYTSIRNTIKAQTHLIEIYLNERSINK